MLKAFLSQVKRDIIIVSIGFIDTETDLSYTKHRTIKTK